MSQSNDSEYICVGICMVDPDSGYCLGCGRPPLPMIQDVAVVEQAAKVKLSDASGMGSDPDSPPDENGLSISPSSEESDRQVE